jgi:DNA (cytosine-5)-methyltransferase 1
VISLFTGAGGLDLGLEAAGFTIRLCVEVDADARKTLQLNRPKWNLAHPPDIHKVTAKSLLAQAGLRRGQLTLLAAGPPCQPFSKSSYWRNGDSLRLKDPRSQTLSECLRIVEAAMPRVLLVENVRGIVFNGKDEALQLLRDRIEAMNRKNRTKYNLQVIHLNTADFGVPQMRERVFFLASRDGRKFDLPSPTHGIPDEPFLTAWDSIGDLDKPQCSPSLCASGRWAELLPSIPEGHNYLWHTPRNSKRGGEPLFGWRTRYWSFLLKLAKNRPAWTIQAAPGPATGPFHWRNRLLSTAELCRLQTFPETYQICGDRRSAYRQLGNAVPCAIGEFLGIEIRRQLLGEQVRHGFKLIPPRRQDCPPPEAPQRVPRRYFDLRGAHPDHPGAGEGPAAIARLKARSNA